MRGLRASFAQFGRSLLVAGGLGIAAATRIRRRLADSPLSLQIALGVSLAGIFAITLVPARGPNELQLVPLIRIVRGFTPPLDPAVVTNAIGNIVLFLPLGAVLCLLGLRRRTIVLTAFCLSAAIETTQLFIPGRTTSSDDVLCNTLGAAVGLLLVSLWPIGRT
jgi:VanZ family protein